MRRGGATIENSVEYATWSRMKARCYNQNIESYKYYGARGITVCDRWLNNFAAFLADMGKRPSGKYSLDRIDNNKGYSPENCRWATWSVQLENRRPSRMEVYSDLSACAFCGQLLVGRKVGTRTCSRPCRNSFHKRKYREAAKCS